MAHYTSLLQSLLDAKWLLSEAYGVVLDLLMPCIVDIAWEAILLPLYKSQAVTLS